ncbi:MAG: Carbonic anhydrase, gamma class, partial [uncultured Rubrobacteraceae bacterium]
GSERTTAAAQGVRPRRRSFGLDRAGRVRRGRRASRGGHERLVRGGAAGRHGADPDRRADERAGRLRPARRPRVPGDGRRGVRGRAQRRGSRLRGGGRVPDRDGRHHPQRREDRDRLYRRRRRRRPGEPRVPAPQPDRRRPR